MVRGDIKRKGKHFWWPSIGPSSELWCLETVTNPVTYDRPFHFLRCQFLHLVKEGIRWHGDFQLWSAVFPIHMTFSVQTGSTACLNVNTVSRTRFTHLYNWGNNITYPWRLLRRLSERIKVKSLACGLTLAIWLSWYVFKKCSLCLHHHHHHRLIRRWYLSRS